MSDVYEDLANDYLSGLSPGDRLRAIDNQGAIDRLGDEAFVRLAFADAVKRAAAPAAVKARLKAREGTPSPLEFFNGVGAPGREVARPEQDPKITAHVDRVDALAKVEGVKDRLRQARQGGASAEVVQDLRGELAGAESDYAEAGKPAPASPGELAAQKFGEAHRAQVAALAEWRRAGAPGEGPLHDTYQSARKALAAASAELKKI